MEVLQAVLMPVGALVTGLALAYGDRWLDRRLSGPAPKMPLVIGFWWVFPWALTAGFLTAFIQNWGDASRLTLQLQAVGLVLMSAASVWAFCARYGFRQSRD